MQIGDVPRWVMSLGFAVLITAALALALTAFQDSDAVTTGSFADNVTIGGLQGLSNTSDFYGTSGTMIGIGILISIVLGAFVYSKTR